MQTNAKWNVTGILWISLLRKSKHIFTNGVLIPGLMVIYHGIFSIRHHQNNKSKGQLLEESNKKHHLRSQSTQSATNRFNL